MNPMAIWEGAVDGWVDAYSRYVRAKVASRNNLSVIAVLDLLNFEVGYALEARYPNDNVFSALQDRLSEMVRAPVEEIDFVVFDDFHKSREFSERVAGWRTTVPRWSVEDEIAGARLVEADAASRGLSLWEAFNQACDGVFASRGYSENLNLAIWNRVGDPTP